MNFENWDLSDEGEAMRTALQRLNLKKNPPKAVLLCKQGLVLVKDPKAANILSADMHHFERIDGVYHFYIDDCDCQEAMVILKRAFPQPVRRRRPQPQASF